MCRKRPVAFPQDAELPGFSRSRLAMWLSLARPNGLGIECEAEYSLWRCFDLRLQNCIGGLFIYLVAGFVKTWAGVFHRVLFLLVHVWSVVMARY
jgi:hypothetical protein